MDEWELDTPEQKRGSTSESGSPGSSPGDSPGDSPAAPVQPVTSARPVTSGEPPVRSQSDLSTREGNRLRGARSLAPRVAVALVILLAGVMIGFFIARSQTSGDEALLAETRDELGQLQKALSLVEDRNWAYYRANQALREELEAALANGQSSTSTTAPGPVRPGGVYRDGVYLVGEDIAPGTYDGVVDGELGYWARLKETDGSTSAIIANGITRGPFVLTIYIGDTAVELRGVTITAR
jgi:hypothetical protein